MHHQGRKAEESNTERQKDNGDEREVKVLGANKSVLCDMFDVIMKRILISFIF